DAHTLDLSEFESGHGRQRSITALTMLDPRGQQLPYTTRDFLSETPNVKPEKKPIQEESKGFTGLIKFDEYGQRTDITLEVIDFRNASFEREAVWNATGYHQINETDSKKKSMGDIKNIKFKVATVLINPYVMKKKDADKYEGKNKYEGYCIDLLQTMSDEEGFDFEIYLNPENSNGKPLNNGSWSGIMGDVIQGRVDMAISDLTITHERLQAVDFTMPFMNLGDFSNSNHSTYQRMWSFMESQRPSVFVSQDKGVERTLKGDYAYLMESSSIEYLIHKYPCDLTTVGGLLDQKGYGIALRQGSPYRSFFSNKILAYEESGKLAQLKKKWWEEKAEPYKGIKCEVVKKPITSAAELHIGQVGGVFLVLIAGTGIGCLIVILEFVWKTKKISRHEREHAAVMMYKELVRVFKVKGGSREVPRKKSGTLSNSLESFENSETASRNN
ncbi:Glutamate receptor: ionotropic kainate 2-like protein, partial [Dinothrombium tinctorium]